MKKLIPTKSIASAVSITGFLVTTLMAGSASAALLANYDIGDGSLGTELFFDLATTGGNDEAGQNYVMQYKGLWTANDQISLTGIAIPIWSNFNDNSLSTVPDGTFTVSFYDLGIDGFFNGSGSETLLGTNTVNFNGGTDEDNDIDAFAALFDTPTLFTAESTGLAIHLAYSNSSRLKSAGDSNTGNRLNLSDGAAQEGRDVMLSLSGSVVPEPSSLALLCLGGLLLARRRR